MEIGPTLHYFMGGIRVDADTQESPTLPGLYAAGECGGGMHGANRLGGNSLSDLVVFGRRAGLYAAESAKKLGKMPRLDEEQVKAAVRRATAILNRETGTNPYLIQEKLQDVMQKGVGIIRDGKEIDVALAAIDELKKETANVKAHGASQYNPGWHTALDLRNLLIVAEAVARAARIREESRGAHTRAEFPNEEKEWLRWNIVTSKNADGSMCLRKIERPAGPPELVKIANMTIEELEGPGAKAAPKESA
jgi:succinate dehydrogenase / fumarate reductase flavoprotein subunit